MSIKGDWMGVDEINRNKIKMAFEYLIELDCDRANCNLCIFQDDKTETKCHLTKPMYNYNLKMRHQRG
jgi:hypothetical protein